jgi:hypothetical protein
LLTARAALRPQVLNMFVDMELLAPQHGGGWLCGKNRMGLF